MKPTDKDTILVVDDTEANIDLVLAILPDYDLIPATSGHQALALLQHEKVDLILLDIMMPGMTGFEVCERLKAAPATRKVPIVFVTALEDESDVETAFELGAYDYIVKPFRPKELRARVQTQLTLHRQYLELDAHNRKLAEAEHQLRANHLRYRAAVETTRDGFWIIDLNGRIVETNPAYCAMSGYDEQTLVGTHIGQLEAAENAAEISAHIQRVRSVGSDVFETRHRRKDGSRWAVEVAASYSPVEGGRIFAFLRDIRDRKASEELARLRHQLSELICSTDQCQLPCVALDTVEQLTDSSSGFFCFIDDNQTRIAKQIWSSRGKDASARANAAAGNAQPIWSECLQRRELVIRDDTVAARRALALPVLREGAIVAIMGVAGKVVAYDEQDCYLLSLAADMTYDFVERKRAEQRIEFMAFNDVLTGLPNRQLLGDRLKQAMSQTRRSNQQLAVCYLDLDGFKPVNDRFGHHVGDVLLVQLAERLGGALREDDTLARLGGDEFVILLNGLASVYAGEGILQRILDTVHQPFEIDGRRIHVSASIGVTFYPTDEADADALVRHADQAMYTAKSTGKSCFRLFDEVHERKLKTRRIELDAFEQALSKDELELHYQPRVDLTTGTISSAEALVRWRHPSRGLLLPAAFLPLIQDTPLEIRLGEWVLQSSIGQHARWREHGLVLPVSVNISPRHLQLQGFVRFVRELLAEFPADFAQYLELEVLETASISDTERIAEVMSECAALGLRFSMDDFGTGYASLSYFHRLPIDVLKIDQNFVRNMLDEERDLDIVEGVLRLAYGLKRPVVAEGVESVELGLMLLQLGCRYAQGYSIAKPMPAAEIPDWLERWRDNNVWHRLQAESKGLSGHYDLNVCVFSHRFWLERIRSFIKTGDPETLPALNENQCQFGRWYKGIGLIRYGEHLNYPAIPTKHAHLHEKARALVALAEAGKGDQAAAQMAEIDDLADELIGLIESLSEQTDNPR